MGHGASTADLSIVLVYALRASSADSPPRFISHCCRIPHLVVCINIWISSTTRGRGSTDRRNDRLGVAAFRVVITFSRISALHGDNVVDRSQSMNWYVGPSLLYHTSSSRIAPTGTSPMSASPALGQKYRAMSEDHHDSRGYACQFAAV